MEVIEWHKIAMTSNNEPAPLRALASSEHDINHQAWKAFNGALQDHYYHHLRPSGKNCWTSSANKQNGAWLMIDYGEQKTVDRVMINGRTSYMDHLPREFYFEASSDEENWEEIGRFYMQNWYAGSPEVFKLKKTTARMFRLVFVSTMGSPHAGLAHLEYGEAKQKALTIHNEDGKVFSIEKESIVELPDNSDEIAYKFGIKPGELFDIDANYLHMKKIHRDNGEFFKASRSLPINKNAKKIIVKEVY